MMDDSPNFFLPGERVAKEAQREPVVLPFTMWKAGLFFGTAKYRCFGPKSEVLKVNPQLLCTENFICQVTWYTQLVYLLAAVSTYPVMKQIWQAMPEPPAVKIQVTSQGVSRLNQSDSLAPRPRNAWLVPGALGM